jgi:hypothetical protein
VIKKNLAYVLTALFAASNPLILKSDIIKGASYYTYNYNTDPAIVQFYSCEGDLIGKFVKFYKHDADYSRDQYDNMLDPNAPKAQPTRCLIQFEHASPIGDVWSIIFYDKNNNLLEKYGYIKRSNTIIVTTIAPNYFPFDRLNPQTIDPAFPLDLRNLTTRNIRVQANSASCLLL